MPGMPQGTRKKVTQMNTDDMRKAITVKRIEYHRNGIGGEGFHTVLFDYADPVLPGEAPRPMIATVFEDDSAGIYTAVLDRNDIAAGEVDRAWRGDNFDGVLREAIEKHQQKEQAKFDEEPAMLKYVVPEIRERIDRDVAEYGSVQEVAVSGTGVYIEFADGTGLEYTDTVSDRIPTSGGGGYATPGRRQA